MRYELLLRAKRARGLTFRQVAKLAGISMYSAYTIMTGRARRPSLARIRRLCRALGVPMREVLADELDDDVQAGARA